MELSSEEGGDIPLPLNSSYGHVIHHNHHHHADASSHSHPHPHPHPHNPNNIIIPSSAPPPPPPLQIPPNSNGPISVASEEHNHNQHHHHHGVTSSGSSYKKIQQQQQVKYRECLKNHAAAMGGTAMDGCGEFMPSGEEGTIEALTCSACNCHRNFHRKEIEGDPNTMLISSNNNNNNTDPPWYHHSANTRPVGRKLLLGHHKNVLSPHEALVYPTTTLMPGSRVPQPHHPHHHPQMIIPYSMGLGTSLPSESDEIQDHDGGGGGGSGVMAVRPTTGQLIKKRYRTKFTPEQKEKMLNFAEKVGWKIQKQEESVVQRFCQEIGVKRRVLKVWMHNNKHNLAKKNPSSTA